MTRTLGRMIAVTENVRCTTTLEEQPWTGRRTNRCNLENLTTLLHPCLRNDRVQLRTVLPRKTPLVFATLGLNLSFNLSTGMMPLCSAMSFLSGCRTLETIPRTASPFVLPRLTTLIILFPLILKSMRSSVLNLENLSPCSSTPIRNLPRSAIWLPVK